MLSGCQNKRRKTVAPIVLGAAFLMSFVTMAVSPADWCKQFMSFNFDTSAGNIKLKKWEFSITDNGFFRLRKYFPNGKQEYYSFSLRKINNVDYLGSVTGGSLVLQTIHDDIIVQTYNDPAGNIDSMSSTLRLPLKSTSAEQLDSLQNILLSFRK